MQCSNVKKIALLIACLWVWPTWFSVAGAAPAAAAKAIKPPSTQVMAKAGVNSIKRWRVTNSPDTVRLVVELSGRPDYQTRLTPQGQLLIDLPNTEVSSLLKQPVVQDSAIESIHVQQLEGKKTRIAIQLTAVVRPHIFVLNQPNRLVIDLVKKFEQKVQTAILPGVTYTNWQKAGTTGPLSIQILDLASDSGYRLRPAVAQPSPRALEPLTSIARRQQAPLSINGGYFGKKGEIYGLLKLDGTLVNIPYQPRTAVGITANGRIVMDSVSYEGWIKLPDGRMIAVNGINTPRAADALTLYNPYYGEKTDRNSQALDLVVKNGVVLAISQGGAVIPKDSMVLSGHGKVKTVLESLKVGDKLQIHQTLGPSFDACTYALGAGPRLLKNGIVALTTEEEQFGSDVAGGRAPRTALGRTKSGHILLVVVDGRSLESQGMSLEELADFMKSLGCWDAMNLDGGGSSEMVVLNKVVNQPSDGKERPLGSALLVMPASR